MRASMKPSVPGDTPAIIWPMSIMPSMPSGSGRKPWMRSLKVGSSRSMMNSPMNELRRRVGEVGDVGQHAAAAEAEVRGVEAVDAGQLHRQLAGRRVDAERDVGVDRDVGAADAERAREADADDLARQRHRGVGVELDADVHPLRLVTLMLVESRWTPTLQPTPAPHASGMLRRAALWLVEQ
jgi:hypothetical protein